MARISNLECKNLLSWFIARTIKLIPSNIKVVVSYSDNAYGHSGSVYASANFKTDKVISSNYHYVTVNGHNFHKKTIWDRAKRMKMSECDYTEKHKLVRVETASKRRWIYKIRVLYKYKFKEGFHGYSFC
jgi:hypothetical protein